MSNKAAATALPETQATSEATVPATAPAPGLSTQDPTLAGSGEAARKKETPKPIEKAEDIESPDDWVKNSARLLAELQTAPPENGTLPPLEETPAAEVVPPVAEVPAVVTDPATEELDPETGEVIPPEPVVAGAPTKLPQHRTRAKNPVDDMALTLFNTAARNGVDITLEEATTQAKALINKKAPATETTAPAVVAAAAVALGPRADGMPVTIAEADAKIAELRAQRKQAFTVDADLDKTDTLDDQIQALRDHKHVLSFEATQAQSRAQQSFQDTVRQSQQRAISEFPECAVKGSPLVGKMLEMDAEWKTDGNPLYYSPEKPYILAQRAAKLLPAVVPASTTTATSPQPAKKSPVQPPVIAPGAARTTQATATPEGQLVAELNQINNVSDYEKAMRKFGVVVSV